jgi:hypothetical protein
MYTREKRGIIYVYRNQESFLASMKGIYPNGQQMMYAADYAIAVDKFERPDEHTTENPYLRGTVCKDRSGLFDKNSTQKVEKILKIIQILLEDSEKVV